MYYELTVAQFSKSLKNLAQILKKAEAFAEQKKVQPEVLFQTRLAVDQFPFLRQVQISCDNAKLGVARLTGKTAPVHDDKEANFKDLHNRITSTLEYLNSIKESDFANSADARITMPWWHGKTMSGHDYVVQYLQPNFYFHLTTAYAILRNSGVEIGKGDYLGEMPLKA